MNILDKIRQNQINAELVVTFIFMIVSGLYIFYNYGIDKIWDILFFWMFPASIMIILTLLVVKIIDEKLLRRMRGW